MTTINQRLLARKYRDIQNGEHHDSGCGLQNHYKPYRCDCGGSVAWKLEDVADELVRSILGEV